MGTITKHLPVKLLIAITYHSDFHIEPVLSDIEKLYSPIELKSEVYDFSKFTSYYHAEMGDNLKKCFITPTDLITPEDLPAVKVSTNKIEEGLIIDQKRQVNIDPGYITQAKLVLATTKNYSHRIYIGEGIFGDLHMYYRNNSYQAQPWTYPDYMDEKNIVFFNAARKRYLEQLAT